MSLANVQQVIGSFGRKVGLPETELSNEGLFSLTVDDFVVALEVQERDDTVTFHVWIGEVDSTRRSQVALALAAANYLLAASQGATLGMDRNSGDVAVAAQTAASTLDLIRFELLLEKLVNLAEHWRSQIQSDQLAEEPVPVTSLPRNFGLQV